jgi:dTMP kinase
MEALALALEGSGFKVCRTREPGGGPFGSKIRALLLDSGEVDSAAELFLFLADRAQHVSKVIRPALARGEIVLCDRFADSTLAYQGNGRGFPIEKLRELNAIATSGLVPDLTLLLDLESQVGLERLANPDRIDSEDIEFHRRVRNGFLAEAKLEPSRFVVIDASQPPEVVYRHALRAINEQLSQLG